MTPAPTETATERLLIRFDSGPSYFDASTTAKSAAAAKLKTASTMEIHPICVRHFRVLSAF